MPNSFEGGHALIVAVAHYPMVNPLSEHVLNDGREIYELLGSPQYCGYPKHQVQLLIDHESTASAIREGLKGLARDTGPQDTTLIYFSGHGGRVEAGPERGTYLLPYDCDPSRLKATAIESEELTSLLGNIRAGRLVVILDACHSAGAGELKALDPAPVMKAGLDQKTYGVLAEGKGRVLLASSRANEVSLILPEKKNSLFTHYLLDALKGAAGTEGDGLIRVFDVFSYVSDKVPAEANQHPVFKAHDVENNFPLALYEGGKKAATARGYVKSARLKKLRGLTRIELNKRLVDRWEDLADYLEIPQHERAQFPQGKEPRKILDWLELRSRLDLLRDAFNYFEWPDLLEVLGPPT